MQGWEAKINLKFILVLISWVVSSKDFDWIHSSLGDGFHKFLSFSQFSGPTEKFP